jgi:class 3 adenylate cyclase
VSQNDADFHHLFSTFPNNRFVTRTYARFLTELRADHVGYGEMMEDTRLLQRGLTVNMDHTHELGLKAFPALPERIQQFAGGQLLIDAAHSQSSSEIENPEDDEQLNSEQTATIKQHIEDLKVPSTRRTRILLVLSFLILMILPTVGFRIFAAIQIREVQAPLPYQYHLSKARSCVFQLAAFSHRYIMEQLNMTMLLPNRFPPPASLGKSWDTKVQLLAAIRDSTASLQEATGLRTLVQKDPQVADAEARIFQPSFKYISFANGAESTWTLTVQSAIMDFIVQLAPISQVINASDPSDVTPAMPNEPVVTNLLENVNNIGDEINGALKSLSGYVLTQDERSWLASSVFMYVLIAVSVVAQVVLFLLERRWIKTNKEETYRCLTCLPKNTVSQLAESLRVLKKDTTGEDATNTEGAEVNKQDDNIVRVFNNGGSNDSSFGDDFRLAVPALVTLGMTIALAFVLTNTLKKSSYDVQDGAPHLDNLLGSYSMSLGAYYSMEHLLCHDTPYWTMTTTPAEHLADAYGKLVQSRDYWHRVRFGGRTEDDTPFSGFMKILNQGNAAFKAVCPTQEVTFADFDDARRCIPTDLAFVLLDPVIQGSLEEFVEGKPGALAPTTDSTYSTMWNMMIQPIYDGLFTPMFESIIGTIQESINQEEAVAIPLIVVFVLIGAVAQVMALVHCSDVDAHIRSVLKLLLHVHPDVVTATSKIMAVLSGDFEAARAGGGNRDAQFFDTLFTGLPDAVMYGSFPDQLVEGASDTCGPLFAEEDFVGRPISDFYNVERFHGDVHGLFASSTTTTLMMQRDGSDVYYEVTSVLSPERIVLTARDATQTVRYNTLIAEERGKSDALLASILPPSLVKRVQDGEKNISFAVQSASISFIDIVEFTPWCGSLPAATVMATLNLLFKKFDDRLGRRATLTKIKCIGDCYMSAGGIFSELNQPAVHSKDMVSFGLDAIAALEELNGEVGQHLRIRVGVNSGGPIVAGVLGVGKPTFEILGPAINMAQQMEHHGVPMLVHISRATYELVYGDIFQIKERGATEINTGTVITYLVSGRT